MTAMPARKPRVSCYDDNIPAGELPLLPDFAVFLKWEAAPADVTHAGITGFALKLKKLQDGRLLIDGYRDSDGSIRIKAWRREDSPHLAALKARYPHIPKAVLAPYRAENILAVLRATDIWNVWALRNAQDAAWRKYWGFLS